MIIERGTVILVNLDPTKGSETGKIRPCVVVTNNIFNKRVPVIQVVPITEWNEKKGTIFTNITIEPTAENGLTKKSIADCLQTRPIDYRERLVEIKGKLSDGLMKKIDTSLKIIFDIK